jgi:hypothetical protein
LRTLTGHNNGRKTNGRLVALPVLPDSHDLYKAVIRDPECDSALIDKMRGETAGGKKAQHRRPVCLSLVPGGFPETTGRHRPNLSEPTLPKWVDPCFVVVS